MSQDGDAVVKANKGKPPTAYGAFLKLADRLGPPPEPAPDAPQQLPPFRAGAPHTSSSEMEVPALEDIGYHQAPTTSFTVSMLALAPVGTRWAAIAQGLVLQAQLCVMSQESCSAASGLALLFLLAGDAADAPEIPTHVLLKHQHARPQEPESVTGCLLIICCQPEQSAAPL